MTTGRRARSMRWFIYVIIGLLVVTQLLALAQFAVWIPLHRPLAGTFPQATDGLAAVGSSFALAYAAGSLVAGPITDRHGRWPVLTGALLGLTATTLVAAISTTWPGYLAARGAQGLTAAAIPVAASSWVSDTLSPRGFAVTEAVFTAAANQGAVQVGQLWGQLVGGTAGWRATFAGLAVAYALATLILLAALALRGSVLAPRLTPGPDVRMGVVLRRALGLTRQPQLVLCVWDQVARADADLATKRHDRIGWSREALERRAAPGLRRDDAAAAMLAGHPVALVQQVALAAALFGGQAEVARDGATVGGRKLRCRRSGRPTRVVTGPRFGLNRHRSPVNAGVGPGEIPGPALDGLRTANPPATAERVVGFMVI
jgi:MFS family permease